jgi:hypothetical protein
MNNKQSGSRKSPSFIGMPRTQVGWWSMGLAVSFFVLFEVWQVYVNATPRPRPTFFSDPLQAFLILSTAATAITGAILGVLALVLKRERSILIVVSTLIGSFVLYWTIGELMGH